MRAMRGAHDTALHRRRRKCVEVRHTCCGEQEGGGALCNERGDGEKAAKRSEAGGGYAATKES